MLAWCVFRGLYAVFTDPHSKPVFPEHLPVSILPSKAAGPSRTRLLICRNSSGSSPPTTVKPKPRRLFFSLVLMKVPFNSDRFRVKKGFPPKHKVDFIMMQVECKPPLFTHATITGTLTASARGTTQTLESKHNYSDILSVLALTPPLTGSKGEMMNDAKLFHSLFSPTVFTAEMNAAQLTAL